MYKRRGRVQDSISINRLQGQISVMTNTRSLKKSKKNTSIQAKKYIMVCEAKGPQTAGSTNVQGACIIGWSLDWHVLHN